MTAPRLAAERLDRSESPIGWHRKDVGYPAGATLGLSVLLLVGTGCDHQPEGCFDHGPSSSPDPHLTSATVQVRVASHRLVGYVDVGGDYYNLREHEPGDGTIRPLLPVADGMYAVTVRPHPSARPGPGDRKGEPPLFMRLERHDYELSGPIGCG